MSSNLFFRPRFCNLRTIGIWGQIVICGGSCSMPLQYCDLWKIYIWSFRWLKYISHIYLVFIHSSRLTALQSLRISCTISITRQRACRQHEEEAMFAFGSHLAQVSPVQVLRALALLCVQFLLEPQFGFPLSCVSHILLPLFTHLQQSPVKKMVGQRTSFTYFQVIPSWGLPCLHTSHGVCQIFHFQTCCCGLQTANSTFY